MKRLELWRKHMSLRIPLATLVLCALTATAHGAEVVDGASFRTELSASRGLVLVDLYADW